MRQMVCAGAVLAACALAAPRALSAQGTAGPGVYRVKCVMCHGAQGRGDGPMAGSLNPRPTDFSDPGKRVATADSAVQNVIRRGRRAMPSFGSMLSPAQVDSLVAFIKTLHR